MSKVLAFIGGGNMGQAMIGGIIKAGLYEPTSIIVSDLNENSLKSVSEAYGVRTKTDNNEAAQEADILVLSVKPNLYPVVIKGIKKQVKKDVIVVTVAAGKDMAGTEEMFGRKMKVVRIMPNTPALVNAAMSGISGNDMVTKEELQEVVTLFESFGEAEIVPEKLMDAVTAVSGSAPAYVYMFIEAMADGAVLQGMPRPQAYKFAAQTVLGAAKMVLDTGMHPGALKDMVTSPGGTTIEAVASLEKSGLRSAVIEAMGACADKSKAMSK